MNTETLRRFLILNLLISLLSFYPTLEVLAQHQADNWVFGYYGGLDFSCNPPKPYYTSFANAVEGGASISDINGQLLFYTNGDVILNKTFALMKNGDDIGAKCVNYGSVSSTQSSLIIPHPNNSNLYYVFTTDCAEDQFSDGLRYSLVDMSLEGGLGSVIEKKIYLISPVSEKLSAVFHKNGKDIWLMSHGVFNNEFYAYLINETGLIATPIVSRTGSINPGGRGYLKFSPDGKRIALSSFVFGFWVDGIATEIHSFDDETGKVNYEFNLPIAEENTYSLSFSPNSKVLYTNCAWACFAGGTIHQYDLQAGTPQDIINSRFDLLTQQSAGSMQLGIDGKLYLSSYGATGLSVLHQPNEIGAACGFELNYIKFPCGMLSTYGIPNFIESYFKNPTQASTICINNPSLIKNIDFDIKECGNRIDFYDASTIPLNRPFPIYSDWEFGDGSQTVNLTPYNVAHVYSKPGTYNVTLTVYALCENLSIKKEVVVKDVNANITHDLSCDDYSVQFYSNAEEIPLNPSLVWDFGDNEKSYDLNPKHTYSKANIYNVKLKVKNECFEKEISKNIKVYDPLKFSLGQDTTFCFNDAITLFAPEKVDVDYLWSNGYKTKSVDVFEEGNYILRISRDHCLFYDTINVNYKDCKDCNLFPNPNFLGNDTINCLSETIHLQAKNFANAKFLWNTGSTESKISASRQGMYWLKVVLGNCYLTDTIIVTENDCRNCETIIPNVFTPNGDGDNDRYMLKSECLDFTYKIKIFNRWGHLVYEGDNTDQGWNGDTENNEANEGIYFYFINYKFLNSNSTKANINRKGTINLIR